MRPSIKFDPLIKINKQKDVNKILPPPQQPQPMDPAAENIMAMSGKPFQSFFRGN